MSTTDHDWRIFRGDFIPRDVELPEAPPWRQFDGVLPATERTPRPQELRARFEVDDEEKDLVSAALLLRRPLLITGKPGIGKSSLAYAVAHELKLGEVLMWPINTRSTLQEGLYRYDAIGRLQDERARERDGQDAAPTNIGQYIKLGPLGTAFLPSSKPRVLLIDETDKSDIDLPNDLLNIFEQGRFEIPELSRLPPGHDYVDVQPWDTHDGVGQRRDTVTIHRGRVQVREFPFIIMTSNGEREFPGPFLRRCIRMEMASPGADKLTRIVTSHLGPAAAKSAASLIEQFVARGQAGEDLSTDQLLNAVFLKNRHNLHLDETRTGDAATPPQTTLHQLRKSILHALNTTS